MSKPTRHSMPNGVPRATDADRIMQPYAAPVPDLSHPSMQGPLLVTLDGRPIAAAETIESATMQAETLYRYFAGTWAVVDRDTRAHRHVCGTVTS